MIKKKNRYIQWVKGLNVKLKIEAGREITHLFEETHINAVNTAIACNRPLLLTGEPGVGKTQLARAVAAKLGRAFKRHTVDAKTEPRDLLYSFDAVARLADAQVAKLFGSTKEEIKKHLHPSNYLRPGPLWWGLNWNDAKKRGDAKERRDAKEPINRDEGDPQNGVVVLIDEIDKAELDVPNGLLEALGEGHFQPEGLSEPVRQEGIYPLVMITTNRERTLPDAFIRRCVVLSLKMPGEDMLIARGKAHCPSLAEKILKDAAGLLMEDRKATTRPPLPGQAEYFDLLRAVEEQRGSGKSDEELLNLVRPYIFKKRESL